MVLTLPVIFSQESGCELWPYIFVMLGASSFPVRHEVFSSFPKCLMPSQERAGPKYD